jgi:hypothetical protein
VAFAIIEESDRATREFEFEFIRVSRAGNLNTTGLEFFIVVLMNWASCLMVNHDNWRGGGTASIRSSVSQNAGSDETQEKD